MGTTITAAVIKGSQLIVANVGDSSVFLIRNDTIRKITRDHTLAEEMLANGLLEPGEMRSSSYNHILTRALGIDEEVEIDIFIEDIMPGDIILMCSDGLTDMLIPEEILNIIKGHDSDLEMAGRQLLGEALQKGGFDNITIILLGFN